MKNEFESKLERSRTVFVFCTWRDYLKTVLNNFYKIKNITHYFYSKLFLFFVLVNIIFYWLAMFTAFPELVFGGSAREYFLIQFPIGCLGGLFDSLSLAITIFMVKRALVTTSNLSYMSHLSVDLLIAICATFWVLFVFSFSGWIISLVTLEPESLIERSLVYEQRFVSALQNPSGKNELKNIYFGLMMGCSAILPTTIHMYLFLKSFAQSFKRYSFF